MRNYLMSLYKRTFVKIIKTLFPLLLLAVTLSSFHKHYFSITTVSLKPKEKSAEITIQLFTDDFYQLLEERFLATPKDLKSLSTSEIATLKEYLSKQIRLTINRAPIEIHYLGLEEEQNFTTLYLEGTIPKKPQRVEFHNSILTEIFPDQINTAHISLGNVTKSVHLALSKPSGILFFNTTKE